MSPELTFYFYLVGALVVSYAITFFVYKGIKKYNRRNKAIISKLENEFKSAFDVVAAANITGTQKGSESVEELSKQKHKIIDRLNGMITLMADGTGIEISSDSITDTYIEKDIVVFKLVSNELNKDMPLWKNFNYIQGIILSLIYENKFPTKQAYNTINTLYKKYKKMKDVKTTNDPK